MRSIEAECSAFLVTTVRSTGQTSGIALDIPSGDGRHSRLLASYGMRVISADLDNIALARGVAAAGSLSGQIAPVRLDATKPLPFGDGVFDLVLIIHFQLKDVLPLVKRLVRSDGLQILETYGGHGENWRGLPLAGQMSTELSGEFDLVHYKESPVRKQRQHVTVKAVGRKRFV